MYVKLRDEQRKVNGKDTTVRTFRNDTTKNELTTYLLHTDAAGNKWWTFEDLFALPFIRQLSAKRVLDLYGHGLALDDIKGHAAEMKALLRSTDAEKYEKVYAKILDLERLAGTMADPVKQCIGLCTVYLLLNDERPDVWIQSEVNVKLSILSLDIDAQSFFLSWWTDVMRHSGQVLKGLSRIASTVPGQ